LENTREFIQMLVVIIIQILCNGQYSNDRYSFQKAT